MADRRLKIISRENVHATTSQRTGVAGLVESFLRRFRNLSFALLLTPLAFVCTLCVGLAAAPGLYIYSLAQDLSTGWPTPLRFMALGCGLSFGYLAYGISILFIVPAVNFILPFRVREFRGPAFSIATIPWYIHNGLTYIVRYTFLEFVTPTPLNILFYRMMGMKIGKGVILNTTNISDPCLITIGDHVTVGGSATIFAHSGQKGYLIISPVTIGNGTNIGLRASIMGGARIGANVTIRPHTAILPKTIIPDGETV